MRVRIERRRAQPVDAVHVFEVVTPRTNASSLTSAENLLAAVSVREPFALEIAADHQARRFLVRTTTESMREHLTGQLGAAYPQATLREVSAEGDPAHVATDEQIHTCVLGLRSPPYLPIRTFTDMEVDPERPAQADPILGVLGALANLPPGWRAVSQLILEPAPDTWCRDYVRLAVQHPLATERVAHASDSSLPSLMLLTVILGLGALGLQAYWWYEQRNWLGLVALGLAPCGLALGYLAVRRLLQPPLYDMELVREKVSRVAFRSELRLSLVAPRGAEVRTLRARLDRIAAAYRHFNLAAGNGFVAHRVSIRAAQLVEPRPAASGRRQAMLTTRELAGVWHLPHGLSDVALLERTTARRWLPLPRSVIGGCRIGVSHHQGRRVPVGVPDDVLRRHMLLVAKTRRGKSSLMLRLAQHALRSSARRGVFLVDPHQDLAEAMLGCVPIERRADVIYLDLADTARPVGLNILDAGLGWPRDRAVANALTVFQREWGDRHWGPRMEDVFRFALLTVYEANAARYAADPAHGRAAQCTLLDVSALLRDEAFRRSVLAEVSDPLIHSWWATYFNPLERRFQSEIMNPVLSKLHRFEGSTAARRIVGQPASTIDPLVWLRDGAVVVVNTARGTLGENASALLGSTLVNLVALAVGEQARLEPDRRPGISLFIDEFHTLPGADYEGILAELSKYGANLVLATQSLVRLESAGRERGSDLRAMVFSNLDALFAFNCSAEDALYLVPELGGALDVQDLVELGEHQCYVRLSTGGERLPTFSVSLDPPTLADVGVRTRLAAESASRFGRPSEEVDAAIYRALARGAEVVRQMPETVAKDRPRRNEHRARKKRPVEQKLEQDHEQEVVANG